MFTTCQETLRIVPQQFKRTPLDTVQLTYPSVMANSSGTILGITGSTGRSTGEHLHITAKYKGNAFNPMAMLEFVLLLSCRK